MCKIAPNLVALVISAAAGLMLIEIWERGQLF
jgi:hypothetical protein